MLSHPCLIKVGISEMSKAAHTELLCNNSARTNWINNKDFRCWHQKKNIPIKAVYTSQEFYSFIVPFKCWWLTSGSSEAALLEGFVP